MSVSLPVSVTDMVSLSTTTHMLSLTLSLCVCVCVCIVGLSLPALMLISPHRYALTSAPPHEMARRFRKLCLHKHAHDDAAVWGTYQVQKTKVFVQAVQSWQHVQLELTIQPYTIHGRNGYLSFDRHLTSERGDFTDHSIDRLEFEVPEEPFRFVRDRRL